MSSSLEKAKKALDRGDYLQCIDLLIVLSADSESSIEEISKARILMITAYIGKGEDEKAISICRILSKSKDPEIRNHSKQLLSILEAPSLERPSNWSIKLPNLDAKGAGEIINIRHLKKREAIPKEPLPKTGPTKAFSIGFSTIFIIIFLFLTLILSGCVQITSEVYLPGPDRMNIEWSINSNSKKILPWQVELEDKIRSSIPILHTNLTDSGFQTIKSSVLTSSDANSIFQKTIQIISEISGIEIPSSGITLIEKNWFIGIQQELTVMIDLRKIQKIPGLKIELLIDPKNKKNKSINRTQIPLKINTGELIKYKIEKWQWNSTGIGIILIFFLLSVINLLQKIRLQMGFGFPELPP